MKSIATLFWLVLLTMVSPVGIRPTGALNPAALPKVGIIKRTFRNPSGCNCTLQLSPDYKAKNNRFVFFEDYDGPTYMNIDGSDVSLKLVSRNHLQQKTEKVGNRSTETFIAADISVRIDWLITKVCPPRDQSCEVTWYVATITVTRNGQSSVIRTRGICGC